ncbi:MAG: tRNA (adenosine(37)-N6)-threonylcarbamoyltransferase complex ATPase subunit type 1 TsaE [Gammaproteobacteria bacterium]|nr:tRNA (adenosine(37)-N6)-threonylcarbamoyltransferase complex ATPase subunit type 1 TsaE [Gammaproteobacteria bacterium]
MSEPLRLTLPDLAVTERLGRALARAILAVRPTELVCYLEGELGAGKTTLVRAVLAELGHVGRVPSPTYTLLEPYRLAGVRVLHMDLYRLRDPAELEFLGLDDDLGPGSLLLVEWPRRGGERLAPADVSVRLAIDGPGRSVEVVGLSVAGTRVVGNLAGEMTAPRPDVGFSPDI